MNWWAVGLGGWRAAAISLAILGVVSCSRAEERQAGRDARADSIADSIRFDSLLRRRRAYEQERSRACQELYTKEAGRHNNVAGWMYDQGVDGCWIEYRQVPRRTEAQCDSMYPPEETTFLRDRLLCHEGRFRTRF